MTPSILLLLLLAQTSPPPTPTQTSQPPGPTGRTANQGAPPQGQRQTAAAQGTPTPSPVAPQPISINVNPTAIATNERADQQGNRSGAADWWMVGLTAVLGAITFRLFQVTRDQYIAQVKATRELFELQRTTGSAIVTLSHVPPGIIPEAYVGSNSQNPIPSRNIGVTMRTDNVGKTTATITAQLVHYYLSESDALPDSPPYALDKVEDFHVPQAPGDTFNQPYIWSLPVESLKTKTLYVLGFVDYTTHGQRRRYGYARKYLARGWANQLYVRNETGDGVDTIELAAGNNLMIVPKRGYNYDRPRVSGEGNDW